MPKKYKIPKTKKRQIHAKKMVGGKFRFAKIFSKTPKGIEGEFKEADDQRKTFLQSLKKKYNELEKANENISIEVLVLHLFSFNMPTVWA
jgi:hypothetical protein